MRASEGLICPYACGPEAAWASPEMEIIAAGSLIQLANHFRGNQVLLRPKPKIREVAEAPLDLKDIKGQESAKRALEIAAAGGHNLLMVGPPGAGKSMLAARLPSILPPLSPAELLEVSMVASVAGEIEEGALTNRRPFRAPHHSASMVALVGGGLRAKPGEISLAHHGVLFLDEFPEFQPAVLDSLRQPLENGEVTIVRANYRVTYPARFMLVGAMNPCRCGKASDPGFSCRRGANERCAAEYQGRLSGPLLDRIDLHIEVPAVTAADLILPAPAEGSREVAARVARARDLQAERYAALGFPACASTRRRMAPALEEIAQLDNAGLALIRDAADAMRLSARGITACCASRAPSRTSTAPRRSAACISPRRCPTARSPTRRAARREQRMIPEKWVPVFGKVHAQNKDLDALPAPDQPHRDPDQDREQDDAEARKRQRGLAEEEDQRRPEADPERLREERKRREAREGKLQDAGGGGDAGRKVRLPIGDADRAQAVFGQPPLRVLQRLAQSEREQQPIPAEFAGEEVRQVGGEQAEAGRGGELRRDAPHPARPPRRRR